jgi:hypothetical protein
MSNFDLNCLVYGDDPGCIFNIKIAPTESVSDLKDLVKEKNKSRFGDVDADLLRVWKVSDPMPMIRCRQAETLEGRPACGRHVQAEA